MHKSLFILLAVCLIGAFAANIMKRDAPANSDNELEKIVQSLKEVSQTFNSKVSEILNPDKIKEGFNSFVDSVNNAAQEFKPKEEKQ